MKYFAYSAAALLLLTGCKTTEIAVDPATPADIAPVSTGVVTDAETRDLLVADCAADRTQTQASCACNVDKMESLFSQSEWDDEVTAIKTGIRPEPDATVLTDAEQAAQDDRMIGYVMASAECYPASNTAALQDYCTASGKTAQDCMCLDTGMNEVMSDSGYQLIMTSVRSGQSMADLTASLSAEDAAEVGKFDQILLTCASFGGWPGGAMLGQEAPE